MSIVCIVSDNHLGHSLMILFVRGVSIEYVLDREWRVAIVGETDTLGVGVGEREHGSSSLLAAAEALSE